LLGYRNTGDDGNKKNVCIHVFGQYIVKDYYLATLHTFFAAGTILKSKLIDIFYFFLAGISGTLVVFSVFGGCFVVGVAMDVLFLIISAYFIVRGFLDIESENKKLSKNWQILSWIAWCLLLLGVILTLTGYKLGINGLGWGGFVLFLLCSFVVPEQANDKNFHVNRRDETGFDDKN
jgi:hypothetical protein